MKYAEDDVLTHGIPAGDIPTVQEIEAYKQYWHKHGFPNMDHGLTRRDHYNEPNNCSWQPTAEYQMWTEMIQFAMTDAKGLTKDSSKECRDCHDNQPCGCMINGRVRKPAMQVRQCPYYHNHRQCAARWFASPDFVELCDLMHIEVSYFRRKLAETGVPSA